MRSLANIKGPGRWLRLSKPGRQAMRYPEKLTLYPLEKIVTKTLSSILGLLMILPLVSAAFVLSETRTVNATIDVSKTGAPISKNIYGQFLEHGGDIVNNGIWSEML